MKKRSKKWLWLLIPVALMAAGILLWLFYPELEASHWDALNERYQIENETALPGQIVFLGDSITEGFALGAFLESDLELYNRGIGGDTTEGILLRLESNVIQIAPAILVLLIGINDLHGGIPVSTVETNLRQIVSEIKTACPECRIYVESLYPTHDRIYPQLPEYWAEITELNSTIEAMAESAGFTFVPVHDALLSGEELNPDYSTDGLHLNAAGYEMVAAILAEVVPELTALP